MFDVWSAAPPFKDLLIALTSILLGSFGIPLPTFAVLIFTGSLLAMMQHGIEAGTLMVIVGMTFALMGDVAWFTVGRIYGANILHFMCRLSLSRDTCVRNTTDLFARHGLYLLLFSRFLPGLSLVTSPLAGASAVTMDRFVLHDALSAGVWISVSLAIGFVFAAQIAMVSVMIRHVGLGLGEAAVTLVVAYIAYKWFWRQLLIHQLRMSRMSVGELNDLIVTQTAPVVIDVRSELQRNADPFQIPGAIFLPKAELKQTLAHVPDDRSDIVYCACPDEMSAALMVKRMRKYGLTNLRPLAGGIAAWRAAGYPLDPIFCLESTNLTVPFARAAPESWPCK